MTVKIIERLRQLHAENPAQTTIPGLSQLLRAEGLIPPGSTDYNVLRNVFDRHFAEIPEGWIVKDSTKGRREPDTQALVDRIVQIVEQAKPITVRGVAYKLLSEKRIKNMTVGYQRVSALLVVLRREGAVDLDAIVDESREHVGPAHWSSLSDYLDDLAPYAYDFWGDQRTRIEVWIEKATLSGVINTVLRRFRVGRLVTHGNLSFTMAHQVAKQLIRRNQLLHVLWVGDFDPSGLNFDTSILDMVAERLYALHGDPGLFSLERVALTADHVARPEMQALSVPVKTAEHNRQVSGGKKQRGDPNAERYRLQYGLHGWEVDALDPNVLRADVSAAIESYIDAKVWDLTARVETERQDKLDQAIELTRANLDEDEDLDEEDDEEDV